MSNLIQFLWLSVYRIITRTATVLNSTFTFHLMDFSISSSYLRPHNFVIFSPVSLSTRYLSYRSLPVPTLLNSFISFPLCDDSLSLQSSCLQLNLFYCTKWPPSFSIFTNVKIIWKPRAQKNLWGIFGDKFVSHLIKEIWKCSMNKWINVCEEYHSPWKVIIFLFQNLIPMRLVTACHCPHVLQHSAMKLLELTAWSTLVLCIKWGNWNKDIIQIFFPF